MVDDEVNVMLKPGNVAKIQLSAGVVDGILQVCIYTDLDWFVY